MDSTPVAAAPTPAAPAAPAITVDQLRTLMLWVDHHAFARVAARELFEDLADLLEPDRARRTCPAAERHVYHVTPHHSVEPAPPAYFLHRDSRQRECFVANGVGHSNVCGYAFEITVPPQSDAVAQLLARYYARLEPAHRAHVEEEEAARTAAAAAAAAKKKPTKRRRRAL